MKLKNLLKGIDYSLIQGNMEMDIEDICYDSRKVKQNEAFVCLVGIDSDGHDYVEDVIRRGCRCLITCRSIEIDEDVTIVQLQDTRTMLSYLSANLFQHPSDKLIKIAVTGTKGKTSVSWMIKNILEKNQEKVGVIGTLGTVIDGVLYSHKNTTPESYLIQKYMAEMVRTHTKYLVMEVSSQALRVGRVNNIIFDYAIFTNLSIDHIGPREHPTYEDYKESKAKLFQQCRVGILNCDDLEYKSIIKDCSCQIYTFGTKKSDLMIQEILPVHSPTFLGTKFSLQGEVNATFQVAAPGNFSAYNATAAVFVTKLINVPLEKIKEGLMEFKVPGRCEIFNIHDKFKVVIDFAHNKISMESIIQTMKSYHPNRIITVFGCGGGRSTERRIELGVVAGRDSDLSIVTMDNPRNDSLEEINQDIVQGITSVSGKYLVIPDRKEAILFALENALENDIILLLGKGHETYQEIKGERIEFDEKKIIQEYMETIHE